MSKPRRRQRDRLRDPETGQWDMDEVRYRSKGWVAVLVALAVIGGGAWFFGGRAWNALIDLRTKEDFIGAGVEDIEVEIPRGSSMRGIGQILEEAVVVKSGETFRRYAQSRPEEAATIQAGNYRMRTEISAAAAFERLLDPAYLVRNVIQLREGQRLTEAVASMAEQTGLPREDFEAVLADPTPLGLPAWSKGNPEGFIFPDTYEIPATPTAVGVMTMTVSHFKTVSAEIDFEGRAAQSPAKAPYTALIMASMVEREANGAEDRAKVARVFYNRMAAGMPMQSDATVAYANNVTGRTLTTPAERTIDSPYNTYHASTAGKLPPGPISSPSRGAMEAAVAPAEGDWLFFATVNLDTGETEFNADLAGHNRSVAKLQEFCKTSDKC